MDKGRTLAGKVAIVTGGGRGIGRVVALALARQGAVVMLAPRTERDLGSVVAEVTAAGGRGDAVVTDVANPVAVDALVAHTVRGYGGIDILVNAAGVLGPIGPLASIDLDAWLSAININLWGVDMTCRAVLPHMTARRHGTIVNLSGGGATAPKPRLSAYAASKAAVVRLTETLAEEVKDRGVTVNAIAPGAVDTRMIQQLVDAGPSAGPAIAAEVAGVRRTGGADPQRAADLAVFLASDRGCGLTGRLISAIHDPWDTWGPEDIRRLMEGPWFTLRRVDRHTLGKLAGRP